MDDDLVPVENSFYYARALREHGVPFELHNVGNRFASTVIVAAITSRINAKPKQPTHSFIGMVGTMKYPSVVMLEQLRTLDKCRVGPYVGSLSDEKMEDVTRALCISLAIDRRAAKGV